MFIAEKEMLAFSVSVAATLVGEGLNVRAHADYVCTLHAFCLPLKLTQ